jgi:protein-tyrosine phosphatase
MDRSPFMLHHEIGEGGKGRTSHLMIAQLIMYGCFVCMSIFLIINPSRINVLQLPNRIFKLMYLWLILFMNN